MYAALRLNPWSALRDNPGFQTPGKMCYVEKLELSVTV